MMASAEQSYLQAVERAVDLLMLLASASEPPSLRQLSNQLHCSPSTVLRLLRALESKGMVERDRATRRYGLGVRVLVLASARSHQTDLRSRAARYLYSLRDLSDETVSLQVLAGDCHVCVDVVESKQAVRRQLAVGEVFPLDRGATGRVFRAWSPEALDRGSTAAARPGSAAAVLAAVRTAGYATGVNEHKQGVRSVSAPIFDAGSRVCAAVTIVGVADRFGPEQVEAVSQLLKAAAAAISLELGYSPPVPPPIPAVPLPAGPHTPAAPSERRAQSGA